jgi:tRNA A-37 threonylcarbamoyl transferase component Bud32
MAIGECVGDYLLLEQIGVGGFCEVFKARASDERHGGLVVALKRLRIPSGDPSTQDVVLLRRFVTEAKALRECAHQNIPKCFDVGLDDQQAWMILEFIEGRNLRAVFEQARVRGTSVPIPIACHIVAEVCAGLACVHGADIIHRDVCPHNVMVSDTGGIKLIDFGLVRVGGGGAGYSVVGTLPYFSPEQASGKALDGRSDLFSLGVILWELVTGERLFVGGSDERVLQRIRQALVMVPSVYVPDIPPTLERVILQALECEPARRQGSAEELRIGLLPFTELSGRRIDATAVASWLRGMFEMAVDPGTDVAAGSVSLAVQARIGEGSQVSDQDAFDALTQGARLAEEAKRARRDRDGQTKRIAAAGEFVGSVDRCLQRRFKDSLPEAERARWIEARRALGLVSGRVKGGELHMQDFLERGKLPALTDFAHWLRPDKQARPPDLARLVVAAVGLTSEHARRLFVLARVRNVLAHRNEYEANESDSLGDAVEYLADSRTPTGKRVIDISEEKLLVLENDCLGILKRE